ncbi:hypothetical protein PRUPE_6G093300 [Prunus persica]|uniref:Pentacotripeptide-repeat region of PRORP domain-containing protein n=1 Tax=Prunus persica TaxID=3760 RepID=A0A251NP99_PRUPE|nr:hypothetical protein PRUPE_6G093300 [Prunus persica]
MLKMIKSTTAAAVASSSSCWSRRGMPRLHSNSTLVVFLNNYFAFFHSQPSKPIKSRSTQLKQLVRDLPNITNLGDAFSVFDRTLQMHPLPSVAPFNQILIQVVKLKHYSAVISLYNQMGMSGIEPDGYTLNILINCHWHLNQMGFSLTVLGNFFKLGLKPIVSTFNALINSFLLENRVAEAAGIFNKMIAGGNNSAAIQLLRKMEERACKPNLVVYNTIIDSLSKDTLVDDALNLFSEMMCKGVAPDGITYTSLIHGVCKLGEWKEATRLLHEMVSKNIYPDVHTFNVLGMVLEAEGMVEIMIQRDIEPNTVTMDKAKKVFELMLSNGSVVDAFSYSILINGFCKQKMMDEAMMLLGEMSGKGLVPNTVTYNTVVDGCCKMGKIRDAQQLFSKMQACGQLPNVQTYAILLDGLCKNRQLSTAIQLFREMEGKKLDVNIVIYTILIEGLCIARKIESARVLFRGLSSKGLQPNARTYNIMIKGLCIGGLTCEAEKLLTEMEEKVCSPDGYSYNIIIQGFINNNETDRAMELIQQMVERGFSADASTTELIVDLLCKDEVDPALFSLIQKENYEGNLPL